MSLPECGEARSLLSLLTFSEASSAEIFTSSSNRWLLAMSDMGRAQEESSDGGGAWIQTFLLPIWSWKRMRQMQGWWNPSSMKQLREIQPCPEAILLAAAP